MAATGVSGSAAAKPASDAKPSSSSSSSAKSDSTKSGGSSESTADKSVGSKPAPKSQAEASAANVGAKPTGSGTAAAQQAQAGASAKASSSTSTSSNSDKGKAAPKANAAGADAASVRAAVATDTNGKPATDMAGMAGMAMTGGAAATQTAAMSSAHTAPVPAGTPNLKQGSSGPIVPKGEAATIRIPDGPGFGGVEGREQNDDDKAQNNYSVTDANFNPHLGLMATDPDTGKPMNYVQHIQTYNAAGYISTFAKDTAKKLEQAQADGKGMILEGSAYLMGLTKTQPSYLSAYGIDGKDIPAKIPGTTRDAREYVGAAEDATGQEWARMHHPESAWDMYDGLVKAGVGGEQALRLAGDDGVSGAGRLNGQNNQDGSNGFNEGELEVWKQAADLQARTGIPVVQTMMAGHDHNMLDPSALTEPAANKRLGITGRDASPARADAIYQGLLTGQLDERRPRTDDGGGGGRTNDDAGDGGGGGGGTQATDGGGATDTAVTGPGTGTIVPVGPGAVAGGATALTAGMSPAEALAYLQTASPDIYAQLMAMQASGSIDAQLAAALTLGVFDDPTLAAAVPAGVLDGIQAALTAAGIGRAGVDARIPLPPGGVAASPQAAGAGVGAAATGAQLLTAA